MTEQKQLDALRWARRLDLTGLPEAAEHMRQLYGRVLALEAQAERAALTDEECDRLIAVLAPGFNDQRSPGERPILRKLARDALNPRLGFASFVARNTLEKQG